MSVLTVARPRSEYDPLLDKSYRDEDLRLIGVELTTKARESQLHKRFAHLRIRGEWFEPAPELLAEAGIQPEEAT